MLKVNAGNFQAEVISSTETVLVDIGAEWCPGCRHLKPIIEKLATEGVPNVKFVEVDADDGEARNILTDYGIGALPTMLLIRNGKLVSKQVGYVNEKLVREFINS